MMYFNLMSWRKHSNKVENNKASKAKEENNMEKIYVNQEGQVLIIKKEERPTNPIANFVEFCPLHCREDNKHCFISDHFE